jgi:hypothetical protein
MIYKKGKIYGRVPAETKVSGVFDPHTAGIDVNSSLRGDGYKNNILSSKRAGF